MNYTFDNDLPAWQRRGVAVYWKQVAKEGFNPITNQKAMTMRNQLFVDMELDWKKQLLWLLNFCNLYF